MPDVPSVSVSLVEAVVVLPEASDAVAWPDCIADMKVSRSLVRVAARSVPVPEAATVPDDVTAPASVTVPDAAVPDAAPVALADEASLCNCTIKACRSLTSFDASVLNEVAEDVVPSPTPGGPKGGIPDAMVPV